MSVSPQAFEAGSARYDVGRMEQLRRFGRQLWRNPSGVVGGLLALLVICLVLLAPVLTTYGPLEQDLTAGGILQGPSARHILGTDQLGRDVFSRVLYGGRISLAIAGASVFTALIGGLVLGTFAGMRAGWWGYGVMRFSDILQSFPLLLLAVMIAAVIGRGAVGIVIAIAVVNVPIFTRLTRARVLQIKEEEFVSAATAMGAKQLYTVVMHVMPNLVNTMLVQFTLSISFAIFIESGLSFLGIGIQAPRPSWGVMIADAKIYMSTSPHLMLAPAGGLFLTVLGFNLFGDALGDLLDPRTTFQS